MMDVDAPARAGEDFVGALVGIVDEVAEGALLGGSLSGELTSML